MIDDKLKRAVLSALRLDDWDLREETTAADVPGWDSLTHINVILAVETRFGLRFKNTEILRINNLGDLQRLVNAKAKQ